MIRSNDTGLLPIQEDITQLEAAEACTESESAQKKEEEPQASDTEDTGYTDFKEKLHETYIWIMTTQGSPTQEATRYNDTLPKETEGKEWHPPDTNPGKKKCIEKKQKQWLWTLSYVQKYFETFAFDTGHLYLLIINVLSINVRG